MLALRPRKCSESGSSVTMTKGCHAFLIAGSGKPRRGHEKRCGSPKQRRGHEKQARAGGTEPGRATARPQKGPAARAAHARARGPDPESCKFSARKICPKLDSSSKTFRNLRETQRTDKKAFRARADSAQSARQEEPSPGPPASETDAQPLGHQPRGGTPARPRLSRGHEGPT